MATDIIGYIRDLAAAGIGLGILFGVFDFNDDQIAGLLLFITTAAAFGGYLWQRYKTGDGTPVGKSK